jgi:phosphohistidine phosphatase SixA
MTKMQPDTVSSSQPRAQSAQPRRRAHSSRRLMQTTGGSSRKLSMTNVESNPADECRASTDPQGHAEMMKAPGGSSGNLMTDSQTDVSSSQPATQSAPRRADFSRRLNRTTSSSSRRLVTNTESNPTDASRTSVSHPRRTAGSRRDTMEASGGSSRSVMTNLLPDPANEDSIKEREKHTHHSRGTLGHLRREEEEPLELELESPSLLNRNHSTNYTSRRHGLAKSVTGTSRQ